MNREDIEELHYITPIENLPSISNHGLLSHNQIRKLGIYHESVAMEEIQDLRAKVRVPGGMILHDYVNFYFHCRNPMMFKRQSRHASLCVLRVLPDVLDIPRTVVTDGNASSSYIRFAAAPIGVRIVNRTLTFAVYWTDPDPIRKFHKTVARCAEVLVPNRVSRDYIFGVYVSGQDGHNTASAALTSCAWELPVEREPYLFFR